MGIPRLNAKTDGFGAKLFENPGDFPGLDTPLLRPARNVPAGGSTDADCKIAFHALHPLIIFQMPRKKCPLAISNIPGKTPPLTPPEIIMLRRGPPAEEAICIRKFGFS